MRSNFEPCPWRIYGLSWKPFIDIGRLVVVHLQSSKQLGSMEPKMTDTREHLNNITSSVISSTKNRRISVENKYIKTTLSNRENIIKQKDVIISKLMGLIKEKDDKISSMNLSIMEGVNYKLEEEVCFLRRRTELLSDENANLQFLLSEKNKEIAVLAGAWREADQEIEELLYAQLENNNKVILERKTIPMAEGVGDIYEFSDDLISPFEPSGEK